MTRRVARRIGAALAAAIGLSAVLSGCSQEEVPESVTAPSTAGVLRNEAFAYYDASTVPGGDDRGLEVPSARITVDVSGTTDRIPYINAPELADGPVPEESPRWITAADGEVLFLADLKVTAPTGMPEQALRGVETELRLVAGETEVTVLDGSLSDLWVPGATSYLAASLPQELVDDLELEVTVGDHVERLRLSDGVRTHSDAVERNGFGVSAELGEVWWQESGFSGYLSEADVFPALSSGEGWASDGHTFLGLRVESDDAYVYPETSRLTLKLADGTELEPIESSGNAFDLPGQRASWFEVPHDANEMTVLVHLSGEDSDGNPVEAGPIEVPLRLVTP